PIQRFAAFSKRFATRWCYDGSTAPGGRCGGQTMSRRNPIVGVAMSTVTGDRREIVQGVMRYANAVRQWVLLEDFMGQIKSPADWPECDGLVIAVSHRDPVAQFC